MIVLTEQHTSSLITHQLAYDAVKDALLSVCENTAKLFPVVNATDYQGSALFSLKSASTAGLLGWKVGTYWPNNITKGKACHGSTVFLLSPETGEIQAVIATSKVNAFRTAAANAVAVDHLARHNASTLTVFGTGHQAEYEIEAVCAVRNIQRVLVVGRKNAQAFVKKIKSKGINASVTNAKSGCEQADILVTVTTADSALFHPSWIKPGTHISAMGADCKGKKELPESLYAHASLFCDYCPQSVAIGEFQHSDKQHITELGQVIKGTESGRNDPQQITIFDSSGLALQDLFVAQRLVEISAS